MNEVKIKLSEMSGEMRCLFSQVEKLFRLLLVCPATSCDAERTFSAVRRLKTWLRSNLKQSRINSIPICHVHKDMLDSISREDVVAEFISRTQTRRKPFGNFEIKYIFI